MSVSDTSPGSKGGRLARLELDPALRERKTTTEHIVEALRAAIYDGQFADGEELNQVELANHFKASRVPVREALRQLQAEGLVNHVAHRRVVVVGLGLSDVVELIEMRAIMEGYLVEKAAPRLDKAQLHDLHRLCDEMDLIDDYGSDWVLKNREFHRVMYLPSGSRAAIALVEQLHLKVERYIRRAGRSGRLRQAAKEHRQILAEIERRDYAAVRLRMQEHILHTADEIRHFEPDAEALARPREPKPSLRRSGFRI